jgi:hypothetical protein
MITYEVLAEVDAALAADYERYMRDEHIPEVLATGCFARAALERGGEGRYRTRYEAASRALLERYLREHTAELRARFAARFPEGIRLSRMEWETLGRMDGPVV